MIPPLRDDQRQRPVSQRPGSRRAPCRLDFAPPLVATMATNCGARRKEPPPLEQLTMTLPRKTPAAARELGITCLRLYYLLRIGRISAPAKDTSGDYFWTNADLARARKALTASRPKRQREEVANAS